MHVSLLAVSLMLFERSFFLKAILCENFFHWFESSLSRSSCDVFEDTFFFKFRQSLPDVLWCFGPDELSAVVTCVLLREDVLIE